MSDVTTTSDSGSPQDHAQTQAVDTSQTTDTDTQGQGDHGEGEGQPVEETEEVEFEGKKYVVPKEIKRGLLREADYTRSKQALADLRREFEGERESFTKTTAAERQILAEGREVVALDWQIEQVKAVDLVALQQRDPEQAQKLFWQLQQLQGVRDQKARELQGKIAQRQTETERESATRRQKALEVIARDVEGWSPELASTLSAFAMSPELGFTAQELAATEDPRVIKLLHLAHIGKQASAKLKAAGSQPQPQPTATRTVGTASPAAKNPDRMSTEEWMAWRSKQRQRR